MASRYVRLDFHRNYVTGRWRWYVVSTNGTVLAESATDYSRPGRAEQAAATALGLASGPASGTDLADGEVHDRDPRDPAAVEVRWLP